ncbi:unnamed protein product [Rhodiola kirilowii]
MAKQLRRSHQLPPFQHTTATPAAAASPPKETASAVPLPEDNKSPAETQALEGHSGTAMFAQFADLNGR